jgi:hypothetical protein
MTGGSEPYCIEQIHSGGQTGVDRAALDAAMLLGITVGGWCPQGRRSEKGTIPLKYPLIETPARSYAVRTEWNARDTDGTLILVLSEISSGTRLTIEAAKNYGKPLQIVHLEPDERPGLLEDENSGEESIALVVEWLQRHRIRRLNVAGPRGSSNARVYSLARDFMTRLLKQLRALGLLAI